MTRLCLIGDSHLAALKTGWDQISSGHKSKLDLTYFGAQSSLLQELDVNGSTLVPVSDKVKERLKATSGGKSAIDVRDYDAFVVVALGFNFRKLMIGLFRRFRSTNFAADPTGTYFVSDACLRKAVTGVLSSSLAINVISKIKAAGGADTVLLPQPVPSEQILQREKEGAIFRTFLKSGDGPKAYDLFQRVALEIAKVQQIAFIEQPGETRLDGFLTRQEYSVGSVRLTENFDVQHLDEDFGHMNSRFGIVVWDKLLKYWSA